MNAIQVMTLSAEMDPQPLFEARVEEPGGVVVFTHIAPQAKALVAGLKAEGIREQAGTQVTIAMGARFVDKLYARYQSVYLWAEELVLEGNV